MNKYDKLVWFLNEAKNRAEEGKVDAIRNGNQLAFNMLTGILDLANGGLDLARSLDADKTSESDNCKPDKQATNKSVLENELFRLENEFERAGGRGVELADRIDQLRATLGMDKRKPTK